MGRLESNQILQVGKGWTKPLENMGQEIYWQVVELSSNPYKNTHMWLCYYIPISLIYAPPTSYEVIDV